MKDSMKMITGIVLGIVLIFIVLVGVGFASGWFSNQYDQTIEKKHNDIERENFKHSKSYVEGAISDLNKQFLQYNQSKDPQEKKAIAAYTASQFANFDETLIDNSDLRQFLIDARNGNLNK